MYELFPTPGTFVWKNLVFLETIPPLSANCTKPAYPIRLFLCIPTNRKNFQKALEFLRIVWYTVSVGRKGDDTTPRPPKRCARRTKSAIFDN